MTDVIQLLPDSVANQIAAGEVIQRPASVIKELVENAVDADSTSIKVIIKDAGKTLIQVIDNGKGMSPTDARLAFERHATSKIRKADDLFALVTKGFRGEALASIAAIAAVELKTRREEDQVGMEIHMTGSELQKQEVVQCPKGSNFQIKNLFYNVPARRKFLKSDASELRQIIAEFKRIALAHPAIEFFMQHNNNVLFHLPIGNLKQRVFGVAGRQSEKQFVQVRTDTHVVKIAGFVSKTEYSKKKQDDNYFFVNDRYFRHPYFHKAIMLAYENLLPADHQPAYFIYFQVDPQTIDVNIHPTKTEIKFEDASTIFQVLRVAVKEGLGKFNVMPSIDFDTDGQIDIPVTPSHNDGPARMPQIEINMNYNPFEEEKRRSTPASLGGGMPQADPLEQANLQNWEKLYQGFERQHTETDQTELVFRSASGQGPNRDRQEQSTTSKVNVQMRNKYVLTTVKSGMMLIDQKRAHERILYERFLRAGQHEPVASQQCLYPVTIELKPDEFVLFQELKEDLLQIGFSLNELSGNTIQVTGVPSQLPNQNEISEVLLDILMDFQETEGDIKTESRQMLARELAKSAAIPYGKSLTDNEMQELIDDLFACEVHNFTPDGKTIISLLTFDELDKRFN